MIEILFNPYFYLGWFVLSIPVAFLASKFLKGSGEEGVDFDG